MVHSLRSWALRTLLVALGLAAGYVMPRPGRQADMLDAVAAVQRHSPHFLITERGPDPSWLRHGCVYLSRTTRTAEEVERLSKDPRRSDPCWAGVVCFRGMANPEGYQLDSGWFSGEGARGLDYGDFAVFGDPQEVHQVRELLAAEGFPPPRVPG